MADIESLSEVNSFDFLTGLAVENDAEKFFFEFSIAEQTFILPADCPCEVIVDVSIAPLPNSSVHLVGLCNLRGVLIPVYQWYLWHGKSIPKKKIILCVGRGEKAVGVLVDKLPATKKIAMAKLQQDDTEGGASIEPLATQYYELNGKRLGMIDSVELGNRFLLAERHADL